MERSNVFANIENKFKNRSHKEIIDLAMDSIVEIFENNDEEFARMLLLFGAKLGIAGDGIINSEETEIIDAIFGPLVNGSLEGVYEIVGSEISDDDYEMVRKISLLGNQTVMPFLNCVLCFAYIDNVFEDEVADRLAELFGLNLLADFMQNGLEEVPAPKIEVSDLEADIVRWFQSDDQLRPLEDIVAHFSDHTRTEIKEALENLCDKGILYGGEHIVGCMYGLINAEINDFETNQIENTENIVMRSDMFRNIEDKFESASEKTIIKTAISSLKKLYHELSDFDDTKKFTVTVIGAKLGVAGDGIINEPEKRLIETIFGQIWKGSMDAIYKRLDTEISDKDYHVLELLMKRGNHVAKLFLYYVLSFAYIDGVFEDDVAEKLDKIFSENLLDVGMKKMQAFTSENSENVASENTTSENVTLEVVTEINSNKDDVLTYHKGIKTGGKKYTIAIPDRFILKEKMEVSDSIAVTVRDFVAWLPASSISDKWEEGEIVLMASVAQETSNNPEEWFQESAAQFKIIAAMTGSEVDEKAIDFGQIKGGYIFQGINENCVNYHCIAGASNNAYQFRVIFNKVYSREIMDKIVEDWLRTMKCEGRNNEDNSFSSGQSFQKRTESRRKTKNAAEKYKTKVEIENEQLRRLVFNTLLEIGRSNIGTHTLDELMKLDQLREISRSKLAATLYYLEKTGFVYIIKEKKTNYYFIQNVYEERYKRKARLEEELAILPITISELEEKLQNLKIEYADRNDNPTKYEQQTETETDEKLRNIDLKLEAEMEYVEKLEEEEKHLQEQLSSAGKLAFGEKRKLKMQLEKMTGQINSAKENVSSLEREKKDTADSLPERIHALKDKISSLKLEIENTEKEISNSRASIIEKQKELASLEADIERFFRSDA